MKADAKFQFSSEFKLGNDRLVLVLPAKTERREINKESKRRLTKIFGSLQQENYSVVEMKRRRLSRMNGKTDLKDDFSRMSFDKDLSTILRNVKGIINDYQENRKRRKQIGANYEDIAQRKSLKDAKLYQGGEREFEIIKTADFLSDLLGKEVQMKRPFGSAHSEVIKNTVQEMIQNMGRWKRNPCDLRKIRRSDYYRIVVCSSNFLFGFLNELGQKRKSTGAWGSNLKLSSGTAVLIESDGLQDKLEVRIPIERKNDGFYSQPFSVTFRG